MNMMTDTERCSRSDAQLVELSQDGNSDAFRQIVERYQSLICALTYSASGSFQASEDLAQVTFITAWCQLRNLREPGRLKSWLCSIARNVTVDSIRGLGRTPTARAKPLDSTSEIPGTEPTPLDHVISKEEEAILWRSLGELPLLYREPLVLFYRQQQSVSQVAESLEVSEDVVRQRLSRGRAMLAEKVTAFVEGALRQTTPGRAFTVGVLAALPLLATPAKAATVGATAKVASAGGLFQTILGIAPIAALGGYIGFKMNRDARQSSQQSESVARFWRILVGCLLAFVVFPLLLGVFLYLAHVPVSKERFCGASTLWLGMMYAVIPAALVMWLWQRRRGLHQNETAVPADADTRKKPFTKWVVMSIIGTGILLGALIIPHINRHVKRLSTAEVQQLAGEHADAKFAVCQDLNGSRELYITRSGNGILWEFFAPAEQSTLSLLTQNGIACPTYLQGRDYEIFGLPGRLLPVLCIFILAAGAVLLLYRSRRGALASPRHVAFRTVHR